MDCDALQFAGRRRISGPQYQSQPGHPTSSKSTKRNKTMITLEFTDANEEGKGRKVLLHSYGIDEYRWLTDSITSKQIMFEQFAHELKKLPPDVPFRVHFKNANVRKSYCKTISYPAGSTEGVESLLLVIRPPTDEILIPMNPRIESMKECAPSGHL
jgi:hypothetical protein